MNELILQNMPLVLHIASKFNCKSSDRQELIAVGQVTLWKYLKKYDASRNVKLHTYLYKPIFFSMCRELEKIAKHRNLPLDNANEPHRESDIQTWEYIPNDISDTEELILDLRIQGYTFREISQRLNMTVSKVRTRYKRVIEKITL